MPIPHSNLLDNEVTPPTLAFTQFKGDRNSQKEREEYNLEREYTTTRQFTETIETNNRVRQLSADRLQEQLTVAQERARINDELMCLTHETNDAISTRFLEYRRVYFYDPETNYNEAVTPDRKIKIYAISPYVFYSREG